MKIKQTIAATLVISGVFSFALYFGFAEAAPKNAQKTPTKQSIIQKTKKQKKSTTKSQKKASQLPQGTWTVVAIYDGTPTGIYIPNTILPLDTYGFSVTFKGTGFCTTHWTDPLDDSKPHCEEPLVFNPDGTFFGKDGKLQAFGGFMKLNGSQLEFYEGGKDYTKYVLEMKKLTPQKKELQNPVKQELTEPPSDHLTSPSSLLAPPETPTVPPIVPPSNETGTSTNTGTTTTTAITTTNQTVPACPAHPAPPTSNTGTTTPHGYWYGDLSIISSDIIVVPSSQGGSSAPKIIADIRNIGTDSASGTLSVHVTGAACPLDLPSITFYNMAAGAGGHGNGYTFSYDTLPPGLYRVEITITPFSDDDPRVNDPNDPRLTRAVNDANSANNTATKSFRIPCVSGSC